MIVVFRGLPGTGKTHLARALVRARPGFLVLSRDALRASLVPHPTFGAEEKALVDDMLVSMAGFLVQRGRDIVIDGMALSSAARVEQFARAAEDRGASARVVECACSEATALERIRRDHGGHQAGDRDEGLYREVKARWEPLARPFLRVDTEGPTGRALAEVLAFIGEAGAGSPGGVRA